MAQLQSNQDDIEEAHKTFMVIFKVHGDAIQLRNRDDMQSIASRAHSFTLSCRNVEIQSEEPGAGIQVFVISKSPSKFVDDMMEGFEPQGVAARTIDSDEMAIFETNPVASSSRPSYAIDVGIVKNISGNTKENDLNAGNVNRLADRSLTIGTAFLSLDPKFSSQGIQRSPIIARTSHMSIGQLQVEYLIITSPLGFNQPSPRPDWLFTPKDRDVGHRGAGSGRRMDLPGELLENTIASYNYIHRHGADMCELDVLVSADGVPVVYHDFDVNAVAAQQSGNQLDKLRVQVNQLTVKQLRELRLLSMHDGDGCQYTLNVPNQEEDNRPFPTLAEVLDRVDVTCGLNIEIKWPQMLETGKMQAEKSREINDFVDRILACIFKHANGRRIQLSTFSADIAIALRLKQSRYPVHFLTTGDSARFTDPTTKSISNAIHLAKAFDLAGINPNATFLNESLVKQAKDRGLLVFAWGKIESAQAVKELRNFGLNGVIYDRIDLIKPRD